MIIESEGGRKKRHVSRGWYMCGRRSESRTRTSRAVNSHVQTARIFLIGNDLQVLRAREKNVFSKIELSSFFRPLKPRLEKFGDRYYCREFIFFGGRKVH